jgi:hypothetical protein
MPFFFVVVSGSSSDPRFSVTDFTNTSAATTVFVTPPFTSGGCVVDCSGTLAAVGAYQGSQVTIYDITNPASPTVKNTYDTGLGSPLTGIGALSLDGTNLLVGEAGGQNIVFIDVSQPPAPPPAPFQDYYFLNGGISAIVLKGTTAVAAGSNYHDLPGYAYAFNALDYTNPSAPTITPYNGPVVFQGPVTCDFDGSTAAVGDGSGMVYVFSIALAEGLVELTGQYGSDIAGISSIAVLVNQVAAVTYAGGNFMSLIPLNPSAPDQPPVTLVPLGVVPAGSQNPTTYGAVSFYGLPELVASTNNGTGIIFFNTALFPNATVLSVAADANLQPSALPTIGFTVFETGSGGICFVATAAFGDPNHPDVAFLQRFRDKVLSHHKLGRDFIAIYQRFGPVLARFVMNRRMLRRASRSAIAMIVAGLRRFVD